MKRTIFLGCIFILLLFSDGLCAVETGEPEVKADAALLYDMAQNEILWEKAGETLMAPASLIKVLNILTAEPYVGFNDEVVVGPLAETVYNGQLMGLKNGDIVNVDDLLYAMMLFSANDAAVALADYLVDDISFYAILMDTKAWALGAVHTTSVNVNGYSEEEQKTTAYDLAVIGAAFMSNKRLCTLPSTKSHTLTWRSPEKSLDVTNINKFLFSYDGATGLKTGTTAMAGKCLMATVSKNGHHYLAVVLNSSDRYGDCIRIMDYGFSLSP